MTFARWAFATLAACLAARHAADQRFTTAIVCALASIHAIVN